MHPSISRVFVRGSVVCLFLCIAGCAEKRADVSGQVTYNGEPLKKPNGKIIFVGPNGDQVAAEIGLDGNYLAANVVAGPNRVAVYYANNAEHKSGRTFPVKGNSPAVAPRAPFLTPAQYASVETSNMSTEVKEGAVFNAKLEGPAIP